VRIILWGGALEDSPNQRVISVQERAGSFQTVRSEKVARRIAENPYGTLWSGNIKVL
jgi:hypothetical protein